MEKIFLKRIIIKQENIIININMNENEEMVYSSMGLDPISTFRGSSTF